MPDELHFAVSIFSLICSVALVFFTISIERMFKGLPRLEKPWKTMLVAILFFILLQLADVTRTIEVGPRSLLDLTHDLAGVGFAALLGYSLYLFKTGWTVPKA